MKIGMLKKLMPVVKMAIDARSKLPSHHCLRLTMGSIETSSMGDMRVLIMPTKPIAHDIKVIEFEKLDTHTKLADPDGEFNADSLTGDYPADDFPVSYRQFDSPLLLCRSVTLDEMEYLSLAMSKDLTRFNLNGVCFEKNRSVSTDGHRAHVVCCVSDSADSDLQGERPILKSEFVNAYISLAKKMGYAPGIKIYKAEYPSGIKCLEAEASFRDMDAGDFVVKITSRCIDGEFPNIDTVMPSKKKIADGVLVSGFDGREFAKIALPLHKKRDKEKSQGISTLRFADNKLEYSVITTIGEKTASMNGMINNRDITIGFNAQYLADACSGNLCTLQMTSELGPCIISPSTQSMFAVAMPARLMP